MTNNFYEYSNGALKALHESARKAYANDRALTAEQKKAAEQSTDIEPAYYGTDIYPDWRKHVDAIEAALTEKKLPFTPIV